MRRFDEWFCRTWPAILALIRREHVKHAGTLDHEERQDAEAELVDRALASR